MTKKCVTCSKEFGKGHRTLVQWNIARCCSIECRGLHRSGSQNHKWKGDNVSYSGIHHWVRKHLGRPDTCSQCKRTATGKLMHWANVSHDYKRVVTDWIRLCAKCHFKYDQKWHPRSNSRFV